MTASVAGAPSGTTQWQQTDWTAVRKRVYRLQMRIAKAIRNNCWNKAKALLHLLSRSFSAKQLAVKWVTSNKGSRTPGIDGIRWKTPHQLWKATQTLRSHGYRAQPLRRIMIPKKRGQQRPLGIPTLYDRAMQALYALGLKPIAETLADPNSYGFREKRSLHDAVKQGFIVLAQKRSAQWILEADIKACFDRIDHDWLLDNVPLPNHILRQWLKSGYISELTLHQTEAGTPQGGIISPILCNMTLDGLEALIIKGRNKKQQKLNVIRYADDFIVTGACPDDLRNEIKPEIERFLADRGLSLSEEKTRIVHIQEGFNFLGFAFRKFKHKLIVTPERGKAQTLRDKVKTLLKRCRGGAFHTMLYQLNRMLRGWAYAHRHVVAKRLMNRLDGYIYLRVRHWLRGEYPSRTWAWISKRYRKRFNGRWQLGSNFVNKLGKLSSVYLFRLVELPIRYHTKIRSQANPYDTSFREYFKQRFIRQQKLKARDSLFLSASSFDKLARWR